MPASTAIADHGGELEVTLDDGRAFTTGSVVICTDAWTNELLGPLGHPLPLTVTREQVTWFEPEDAAAFAPERFPIWIWLDQPSFYGFPAHAGRGPKVGQDVGGRDDHGDDADVRPGHRLPRPGRNVPRPPPARRLGRRASTKTCLYTLTPDRDFVIDRVPDHPGIVVALGAAHGYKFAALFGRLLADLALDPARQAAGLRARPLRLRPAGACSRARNESRRQCLNCPRTALRGASPRANLAPATHDATAGPCPAPAWRRSHAIAPRRPSRPVHRRRRHRRGGPHPAAWPARARMSSSCSIGTDQKLRVLNPWYSVHGRRLRDLPDPVRAARELRHQPPADAGLRGRPGNPPTTG